MVKRYSHLSQKNKMLNNFDTINPNSIKSINVLKDKNAIDKYDEKGKNGVIEVELKIKAIDSLNKKTHSRVYNFCSL